MAPFRAFRVDRQGGDVHAEVVDLSLDDLSAGDVVIRAHYSGINYKDALAVTGRGRILRRFPLVAGVDVSGTVIRSGDARYAEGDAVLVTGCGLGESHDGGFSEVVRVPADWVVPLPAGLGLFDVMALGTAGFTAALAIDRLEQNGLEPGQGPVIVSGATGGVGSIAIDMLAGSGYEVVALSRKADADGYLRALGAVEVVNAGTLEDGGKPLEKAQWAAAIDNVGGDVLGWLVRTLQPWGSVASIGLAGGAQLETTVMPFILRGVSILGITSANCPMDRRRHTWSRIAADLKPAHLEAVVAKTITLDELAQACEALLKGEHRGRVVVDLGGEAA